MSGSLLDEFQSFSRRTQNSLANHLGVARQHWQSQGLFSDVCHAYDVTTHSMLHINIAGPKDASGHLIVMPCSHVLIIRCQMIGV